MGCLCSKDRHGSDPGAENDKEKQNQLVTSVPVVAPSSIENVIAGGVDTNHEESVNLKSNGASPVNISIRGGNLSSGSVRAGNLSSSSVRAGKLSSGSVRGGNNPSVQNGNASGSLRGGNLEGSGKTRIVERPKDGHYKRSTTDMGAKHATSRMMSMPHGAKGEQAAAGWPSWLTSVAAEAIQGWVPRSAESFEKLHKIGQGTYSSVYKARDLTTNKIVAMKKVRFVNMDPESVRFMAREICVLRKLDHPNVMKLEALVTSRISGSLYLVFEYMEHDLAGLAASPGVTFTEPQVKCYMQQMFRGLEHCHSRGILHRDIKGSNLLIDNDGVLKIGDFGLATFLQPNQAEPLTSHVVTLWYRAPELLLGATEYGPAIDMWSTGCILAELFGGKPIMPGRTEVEQIHKIFKLCGSPAEEYWSKSKLPHATSFKPQQVYRRRLPDTFKDFPASAFALVDTLLSFEPEKRGTATSALKSQFFITKPLPCDPTTLPKYPPSKELDAKLREEEARRQKDESVKGGEAEQANKKSKSSKVVVTPDGKAHGQGQPKSISVKVIPQEDSGAGFPIEPRRGNKNGYSQSNSMIHPNAGWTKKVKEDAGHVIPGRTYGSSRQDRGLARQTSQASQTIDSIHIPNYEILSNKESMVYEVPKRNRILCSGPLVPTGGNMEDMLKEHERQMQEAVRKSRLEKNRSRLN